MLFAQPFQRFSAVRKMVAHFLLLNFQSDAVADPQAPQDSDGEDLGWVKANPNLRGVLGVLIVVCLLFSIGIGQFLPRMVEAYLADLADGDAQAAYDTAIFRIQLLGLATLLIPGLVGGYLVNVGARAWTAERYPYPGMVVARDTRVVVGPAARRRGLLFGLIGLGILALGCYSAWGSYVSGTGIVQQEYLRFLFSGD